MSWFLFVGGVIPLVYFCYYNLILFMSIVTANSFNVDFVFNRVTQFPEAKSRVNMESLYYGTDDQGNVIRSGEPKVNISGYSKVNVDFYLREFCLSNDDCDHTSTTNTSTFLQIGDNPKIHPARVATKSSHTSLSKTDGTSTAAITPVNQQCTNNICTPVAGTTARSTSMRKSLAEAQKIKERNRAILRRAAFRGARPEDNKIELGIYSEDNMGMT